MHGDSMGLLGLHDDTFVSIKAPVVKTTLLGMLSVMRSRPMMDNDSSMTKDTARLGRQVI